MRKEQDNLDETQNFFFKNSKKKKIQIIDNKLTINPYTISF